MKKLATILFCLFGGCMKAPSTVIQKGSEVSCSSIDEAISATQHPNVLNIQPGEFASTDTFTMVDGPYESLSEQEAVTVVARAQTPTEIDLTIQDQLNENINGTFKSSTKQGTAAILLGPGTQSTQKSNPPSLAFTFMKPLEFASTHGKGAAHFQQSGDPSVQGMDTFQSGMQVHAQDVSQGSFCQAQTQGLVNSYHNLTTQNSTLEIPSAVKARPDCGGITNCNAPINTQILQFDRWVDDPNNAGQEMKVTTYIVTSSSVPFFASVLSQCMQYSWPVSTLTTTVDPSQVGQFVLITTCSNVSDFTYGKATP